MSADMTQSPPRRLDTCSPPAENSVKTLGPFSLTIAVAVNPV